MYFGLKKTLILLIIAMLYGLSAHAFDLDETVNDEIRKNYNDTKLIEDTGVNQLPALEVIDENLPELPNITKHQNTQKQPDIKKTPDKIPQNLPSVKYTTSGTKIKKGTSFQVISTGAISDWLTKGATVKFKTTSKVGNKNYTIPVGTMFTGEVVESHQPQITCNGGLVAIKVHSMNYKGQTVYLNAYVTRANDKKIFFNDIKGQRTYLKTMWKKGNWGRTMFGKMMNVTSNLGSNTSTLILTPFPFVYGTICWGANTLLSPITAFFSKGGHVSIPAGSKFVLKLNEATYID